MRRGIRSALIGAFIFCLVPLAAQADSGAMTPRQIYKSVGKAVVLVFATDGSAMESSACRASCAARFFSSTARSA